MSMASASIPEHGFDAWLAHKRSRRVKNWLIVAAAAAVLAWCFKDTILFDTDWARMGGALGIAGHSNASSRSTGRWHRNSSCRRSKP